jgi:uncharacterized coiled-coil protein SlyX
MAINGIKASVDVKQQAYIRALEQLLATQAAAIAKLQIDVRNLKQRVK